MDKKSVSSAIKYIAIGYVMIYVHINIGPLDILPNFVGYFIIVSALPTLAQKEKSAMLIKPLGIVLALWNIVESVVKIGGVEFDVYIISIIIGILNIYFNFQLITNIAEFATEEKRRKRLLLLRSVYVVFHTVTVIIVLIPNISTVALATGIVQLVLLAWICIELFLLSSVLKNQEQENENQETQIRDCGISEEWDNTKP